MKVVHVFTAQEGGAGLCAARIIKATSRLGVETRAVIAKGIPSESVDVVPFAYPWSDNWFIKKCQVLLKLLRLWPRSLRYARKIARQRTLYKAGTFTSPLTTYTRLSCHPWIREADIVHLHWIGGFVDYPSFFKNVDKPIVWTIHDENPGYGGFHYALWRTSAPESFRRLDSRLARIKQKAYQSAKSIHLVAISTMMAEFFKSNTLLKSYPSTLIFNGFDEESFKSMPPSVARRALSLPADKVIFLFSAYTITEDRKGLRQLIAALERLQRSDILLVCLGRYKEKPSATFEIRCEGFVSDCPALSQYYSAADFFVLPSFQEAFAQTPLEAMACGTPVVAFPCSGARDLINPDNGIVCDDFTVEALQKGILQAMQKSYDKDTIIRDLRRRFSYDVIARQYLTLYRKILQQHEP